MRLPLVPALLLAVALALAGCSREASEPEPVRAVRTVKLAAGNAGRRFEFAAEVRARTESRLGFRVGGKIARRDVDLGDAVKAGQVLARLDPRDLVLGREGARAALNAAQASYTLAAAEYKRYQELLAQGFISAAELERRDTTLKSAQAALEQARAEAAMQGNQAAYASLVADAPGVVTGIEAEPGQVVAAGTPVVRIAQDGPRDVVFAVPEDRLSLVRPLVGQENALQVRLWGAEATVPATVREIAAAADPVTRTFQVKAGVGTAEVKLGQTATVLIETAQASGVIRLPLTALRESGGQSSVWLLDAATMTVHARPVRVAGADGNEVVIASGLAPGQEIVTAGVHVLTEGQKVRRYAAPSAGAPAAGTAAASPATTPSAASAPAVPAASR
jgi:multidrug efflux system membrane fusion protein